MKRRQARKILDTNKERGFPYRKNTVARALVDCRRRRDIRFTPTEMLRGFAVLVSAADQVSAALRDMAISGSGLSSSLRRQAGLSDDRT